MINQDDFNKLVASNIAMYRKHNGLTQSQLAEKLNYSDKAVSKWERGECLPEFYVIAEMANIFDVSVNDLLAKKQKPRVSNKALKETAIILIACCMVWVVALIAFFILKITTHIDRLWLTFIYAIPVTTIVILVFSCIFRKLISQIIMISATIWTIILSLYLSFSWAGSDMVLLYFIGIPIQIGMLIWYVYRIVREIKHNKVRKQNDIDLGNINH